MDKENINKKKREKSKLEEKDINDNRRNKEKMKKLTPEEKIID